MSNSVKQICVIGAGSAGLTAIKSCIEEGLQVVCYEKTTDIAGLWCYRSDPPEGVGRVQKNTITNTSKEINGFSDFPYPKEFPNFMSHKKVYQYFQSYAQKFDLIRHIRFEHSVLKVEKSDDYDTTHRLKVTVRDESDKSVTSQVFDGVMVCNGHHTRPRMQSFPGMESFKGKIVHSRDMTSSLEFREFENKNAVVVGIGNSGCDSAIELSNICDNTYMALRSGSWVFPKVGPNGMPFDYGLQTRLMHKIINKLPFPLICWYFETFFCNNWFDHRLYGIEPNFRVFSEQNILNDVLPSRILSGKIIPKKNIRKFTEDGVVFYGEERETKCDLVVMATGYHHNFPLIDKTLFDHSDDKPLDLYKQVFPQQLTHYSLAIIGAVQPTGGIFAVFEMQCRWYAMLMTGKCQFPTHDHIVADILAVRERRKRFYYPSHRNELTINWISYMDDIADIIGVKPHLQKYLLSDTKLFVKLVFGTCLPYQYRLEGRNAWSGARDAIMQSDYRVRYALNPNEAKSGNYFRLSPNFYRIVFSLILLLFAFIVFD